MPETLSRISGLTGQVRLDPLTCTWRPQSDTYFVFSFKIFFFFLDMDHFFKVFIEFCYNIAFVLCFGFLAARHVGS